MKSDCSKDKSIDGKNPLMCTDVSKTGIVQAGMYGTTGTLLILGLEIQHTTATATQLWRTIYLHHNECYHNGNNSNSASMGFKSSHHPSISQTLSCQSVIHSSLPTKKVSSGIRSLYLCDVM